MDVNRFHHTSIYRLALRLLSLISELELILVTPHCKDFSSLHSSLAPLINLSDLQSVYQVPCLWRITVVHSLVTPDTALKIFSVVYCLLEDILRQSVV